MRATASKSALLDQILRQLWNEQIIANPKLSDAVAVVAVGGYGRSQLFPQSDVDLLFCSEKPLAPEGKEAVRRVSQSIWDLGLRASSVTRTVAECERFLPENPEFSFALLDRRLVTGSSRVFTKSNERVQSKLLSRDIKSMRAELLSTTRERHGKYGNTLFHLEPNIKDSPGGLRDANICAWLSSLQPQTPTLLDSDFETALRFLFALRCFLHYRHDRDDNVLDWLAQDAAAVISVGLPERRSSSGDASLWMRSYFRYARIIHRTIHHAFEDGGQPLVVPAATRRAKLTNPHGISIRDGKITLDAPTAIDLAAEPETVLEAFAAVSKTGLPLDLGTEQRITLALPLLATHLDEWPALWNRFSEVLLGEHAGAALRSMHTIGVLELILPEFHGIDALVVRDAYHRYTVDEHTFVLIDVLHELELAPSPGAPEWRKKFGSMTLELHHRSALYLAALLHDTGKGRVGENHAVESASIASAVLTRLEVDAFDSELVKRLIETHLEMSSALRRDIFDTDTVRTFTAKVQTHELLRMLTVFTYADIHAVHPDALTPWKAENLWRLFMVSSNQLDRNVDDERIHTRGQDERVARVLELLPSQKAEMELFLEGFPERYMSTKPKDVIFQHFSMTRLFEQQPFQIAFAHNSAMSEITLVTRDKARLFSDVAGALAAKGMNVVSAEAFANASGVVVDTFRFTDTYRTLDLNPSERESFVESVREMLTGANSIERMLQGRRSRRRRVPRIVVQTLVTFDETASTHSTLMQVVAQDSPGLLRAISEVLGEQGHNVEVALIDTEGDTAIDVFYLTSNDCQLTTQQKAVLHQALLAAIEANAAI